MKKILFWGFLFWINIVMAEEHKPDLYVFNYLNHQFYKAQYDSYQEKWYPKKVTETTLSKDLKSVKKPEHKGLILQKDSKNQLLAIAVAPTIRENRYVTNLTLYKNAIIGSTDFQDIFQAYICNYKDICDSISGLIVTFDNLQNYWDGKEFQILSQTEIKKGKKDGIEKVYRDGKLIEVCTYKNGIENGPIIQYHPNGYIHWKGYYKNGRLNGLDQTFNEKGQLEAETTYVDNVHKGPMKSYWPNGTLQAEGNYIGEGDVIHNLILYTEKGDIMEKKDVAIYKIGYRQYGK